MNVTIEEEERQTTLLALAELSLRRPGWLDHLERIADKFSGRKMFDGFRETSSDLVSESSSKPILRSAEEIARFNQTGIDP